MNRITALAQINKSIQTYLFEAGWAKKSNDLWGHPTLISSYALLTALSIQHTADDENIEVKAAVWIS